MNRQCSHVNKYEHFAHMYLKGSLIDNGFMEINMTSSEIRRYNLQYLINDRFEGTKRKLALHIGMESTSLSRWFRADKGMNDASARSLEKSMELPRGWMDMPHKQLWKSKSSNMPEQVIEMIAREEAEGYMAEITSTSNPSFEVELLSCVSKIKAKEHQDQVLSLAKMLSSLK